MKEFIKQALRDRYDQFVGSDEILAIGKIINLKKSDLKFIKKHLPYK